MLKTWQSVIPDQNKELKMTHVLCELHFKKEDIDRERVVYKKGGIVEREVRKQPILNDEAVPCYFSESLRPREAKEEYAVKFELPVNVSALLKKEYAANIDKKRLKELERKSFYEDLNEHIKKNCIKGMLGYFPHPYQNYFDFHI